MNFKALMAALGVIVFIGINSDAFGDELSNIKKSSKKLDSYTMSKF